MRKIKAKNIFTVFMSGLIKKSENVSDLDKKILSKNNGFRITLTCTIKEKKRIVTEVQS